MSAIFGFLKRFMPIWARVGIATSRHTAVIIQNTCFRFISKLLGLCLRVSVAPQLAGTTALPYQLQTQRAIIELRRFTRRQERQRGRSWPLVTLDMPLRPP